MFKRTIALLMLLALGVSTLGAASAVACDHAASATHHHGAPAHQPMPASHTSCPMGCPSQATCTATVSMPSAQISLLLHATPTLAPRVDFAIPPVISITSIFHPPRNF